MDWDGKVAAATLQCVATQRALAPGEVFVSALVPAGPDAGTAFVRRDYALDAWSVEDPANVISWWKQVVPAVDRKRQRMRLDAAALSAIFRDLKDSTQRPRQCFCYVVALCLMRMKALRFVELAHDERGACLVVEQRGSGVMHRIRDPDMSAAEEAAVTRNLQEVVEFGSGG